MVWEQDSRMIIMVRIFVSKPFLTFDVDILISHIKITNLRERGREQCVKYWPEEDDSPLIFRTLEVTSVDAKCFGDYMVLI